MPPRPRVSPSGALLSPAFPLLAPRLTLLPRRPWALLPGVAFPQSIARRTLKTIDPRGCRVNRFNHSPHHTPLGASHEGALARLSAAQTLPPRAGALAVKKGMTSLFDPDTGKRIPCTVLQLDRVEVVGVKTRPRHGYWAVQVGTGWKRPHRETRPMLGHWAAQKVSPKERVVEFRVKDGEGLPSVGMHIGPSWFKVGQFVDARSNSRGMGFAGVMKRWGFGGQPASHGVSLTHRSLGSAGGSQGSGSRVLPGKKMAGRMGNKRITVQSLKVLRTDEEAGLVIVNGCLAGPKGCYVKIQDAVKKPWPDVAPVPYVEPPIKEPTDATADSTV